MHTFSQSSCIHINFVLWHSCTHMKPCLHFFLPKTKGIFHPHIMWNIIPAVKESVVVATPVVPRVWVWRNVSDSKCTHWTVLWGLPICTKYCSLSAVKQVWEKVSTDAGEPAALLESSTVTRIYFSSVQPHSWLHLFRWKHDRHTVAYSYKKNKKTKQFSDEVLFICYVNNIILFILIVHNTVYFFTSSKSMKTV